MYLAILYLEIVKYFSKKKKKIKSKKLLPKIVI